MDKEENLNQENNTTEPSENDNKPDDLIKEDQSTLDIKEEKKKFLLKKK